jgi:hypothetical protein
VAGWTDAAGGEHSQRFGIYATDVYVTGSEFVVAYDPDRPTARAYPADPDETLDEDNITAPQLFAGLGAVLLLLGWAVRGWAFRRAARRPAQPATATVFVGEGRPPPLGFSWWLRLEPPDGIKGRRWQRVTWHPALEEATGPLAVSVRGPMSGPRRVVVELADGTRLVPVRGLREVRPQHVDLVEVRLVRPARDDAVLLPVAAILGTGSRWRRGLFTAVAGAAVGAVGSLAILGADPVGLVCFVVAATVLAINVWAMVGAGP